MRIKAGVSLASIWGTRLAEFLSLTESGKKMVSNLRPDF